MGHLATPEAQVTAPQHGEHATAEVVIPPAAALVAVVRPVPEVSLGMLGKKEGTGTPTDYEVEVCYALRILECEQSSEFAASTGGYRFVGKLSVAARECIRAGEAWSAEGAGEGKQRAAEAFNAAAECYERMASIEPSNLFLGDIPRIFDFEEAGDARRAAGQEELAARDYSEAAMMLEKRAELVRLGEIVVRHNERTAEVILRHAAKDWRHAGHPEREAIDLAAANALAQKKDD